MQLLPSLSSRIFEDSSQATSLDTNHRMAPKNTGYPPSPQHDDTFLLAMGRHMIHEGYPQHTILTQSPFGARGTG